MGLVLLLTACDLNDNSTVGTVTKTTQASAGSSSSDTFGRIPTVVDEVQPTVVSVITDTAQGSGVIYRDDGYVITNQHVIAGASKIQVELASGQRRSATVRASTDLYDIAVLKLDRGGLPAASFALALPDVGTLALAMGNPLGFENSVSAGIVSGLHRVIPAGGSPALVDLIQTDAAISPGNSGGALVNDDGKVIGINVAYIPPQGGAVSVGFAIPARTAVQAADQLIAKGKVDFAYLGIRPEQVTPELNAAFNLGIDTGVLVAEVVPGGPAAKAGIARGDVIVRMDDRTIETIEDLFAELREHKPGETVTLRIKRGGEDRTIDLTLGDVPGRR